MKKNNKGFSLVELIVVIAIMAILAAVAVVSFSLYIPKAQQSNDKQMIADLEDILVYEGYAGTFEDGEGGYVIIGTDGVVDVQGAGMIEALTNAYGADYENVLKLAYDKWGNNGLLTGMDASVAMGVANSSYLTGNRADQLLADVEKMTGVANYLSGMVEGAGVSSSISGMFTKNEVCAIDATAAKHGYTKNEGESWEDWATRTNNQVAYSNLLVLTAADEYSNAIKNGTVDTMSDASKLIIEFSSYYAFASQNDAFADEFNDMMNELSDINDLSEGNQWFTELQTAANANGFESYDGTNDQTAFAAIMSSVSNSSNAQAGSLDLTDATLFTEGAVNDMYNDYLTNVNAIKGFYDASVDADAQLDLNLEAGQVAVVFIQKDGKTVVTTSLVGE